MTTLYIRLPSKAAADGATRWTSLECPYALVAHGDEITREGKLPLAELSDAISRSQRVVLVLAASDVTVLRLQVPPLSAARLKAALPNLAEDQLMSDPTECVLVAGAAVGGLRTVAVVQRAWLEVLAETMRSSGATNIAAIPAQLCLPYQEDTVSAAVAEFNADVDLTVRLAQQDGIGLPLQLEAGDSAAEQVLQALGALVPASPVSLYVPQNAVRNFQEAVDASPQWNQRTTVIAESWSHLVSGAQHAGLDLMSGLGGSAANQASLRPWRWAIGLAVAVLLVNAIALNADWWRMKREANALRAGMIQTYRTAFPKETVIVDPAAQMQRKVADAQRNSGQLAPDDFIAMVANFGEAWAGVSNGAPVNPATGIASIEYRERNMMVRLKPNTDLPTEKIKAALAVNGLSLTQPEAGAWQIRSAK
ncbi:type II secretion system protein GspL [soil metagenome]